MDNKMAAQKTKKELAIFSLAFETVISTVYLGTEGRRLISVQLSSLGHACWTDQQPVKT